MILNISERLTVLNFLPQEGNFATLKILGELRMNLSYTEEESKEWGIESDEEAKMIKWKENGETDIPIGEKATGIIVDELRKLEKGNKLTDLILPVYEKFIPTTE